MATPFSRFAAYSPFGAKETTMANVQRKPGQSPDGAKHLATQRVDQYGEVTNALSLISAGVETLDKHQSFLAAVGGASQVDLAARLNALVGALGRHLEPMKADIKARGIQDQPEASQGSTGAVLKGSAAEAVIRVINKTVFDMDKVKDFLGKKVAQYKTQRSEVQVNFRVKG